MRGSIQLSPESRVDVIRERRTGLCITSNKVCHKYKRCASRYLLITRLPTRLRGSGTSSLPVGRESNQRFSREKHPKFFIVPDFFLFYWCIIKKGNVMCTVLVLGLSRKKSPSTSYAYLHVRANITGRICPIFEPAKF